MSRYSDNDYSWRRGGGNRKNNHGSSRWQPGGANQSYPNYSGQPLSNPFNSLAQQQQQQQQQQGWSSGLNSLLPWFQPDSWNWQTTAPQSGFSGGSSNKTSPRQKQQPLPYQKSHHKKKLQPPQQWQHQEETHFSKNSADKKKLTKEGGGDLLKSNPPPGSEEARRNALASTTDKLKRCLSSMGQERTEVLETLLDEQPPVPSSSSQKLEKDEDQGIGPMLPAAPPEPQIRLTATDWRHIAMSSQQPLSETTRTEVEEDDVVLVNNPPPETVAIEDSSDDETSDKNSKSSAGMDEKQLSEKESSYVDTTKSHVLTEALELPKRAESSNNLHNMQAEEVNKVQAKESSLELPNSTSIELKASMQCELETAPKVADNQDAKKYEEMQRTLDPKPVPSKSVSDSTKQINLGLESNNKDSSDISGPDKPVIKDRFICEDSQHVADSFQLQVRTSSAASKSSPGNAMENLKRSVLHKLLVVGVSGVRDLVDNPAQSRRVQHALCHLVNEHRTAWTRQLRQLAEARIRRESTITVQGIDSDKPRDLDADADAAVDLSSLPPELIERLGDLLQLDGLGVGVCSDVPSSSDDGLQELQELQEVLSRQVEQTTAGGTTLDQQETVVAASIVKIKDDKTEQNLIDSVPVSSNTMLTSTEESAPGTNLDAGSISEFGNLSHGFPHLDSKPKTSIEMQPSSAVPAVAPEEVNTQPSSTRGESCAALLEQYQESTTTASHERMEPNESNVNDKVTKGGGSEDDVPKLQGAIDKDNICENHDSLLESPDNRSSGDVICRIRTLAARKEYRTNELPVNACTQTEVLEDIGPQKLIDLLKNKCHLPDKLLQMVKIYVESPLLSHNERNNLPADTQDIGLLEMLLQNSSVAAVNSSSKNLSLEHRANLQLEKEDGTSNIGKNVFNKLSRSPKKSPVNLRKQLCPGEIQAISLTNDADVENRATKNDSPGSKAKNISHLVTRSPGSQTQFQNRLEAIQQSEQIGIDSSRRILSSVEMETDVSSPCVNENYVNQTNALTTTENIYKVMFDLDVRINELMKQKLELYKDLRTISNLSFANSFPPNEEASAESHNPYILPSETGDLRPRGEAEKLQTSSVDTDRLLEEQTTNSQKLQECPSSKAKSSRRRVHITTPDSVAETEADQLSPDNTESLIAGRRTRGRPKRVTSSSGAGEDLRSLPGSDVQIGNNTVGEVKKQTIQKRPNPPVRNKRNASMIASDMHLNEELISKPAKVQKISDGVQYNTKPQDDNSKNVDGTHIAVGTIGTTGTLDDNCQNKDGTGTAVSISKTNENQNSMIAQGPVCPPSISSVESLESPGLSDDLIKSAVVKQKNSSGKGTGRSKLKKGAAQNQEALREHQTRNKKSNLNPLTGMQNSLSNNATSEECNLSYGGLPSRLETNIEHSSEIITRKLQVIEHNNFINDARAEICNSTLEASVSASETVTDNPATEVITEQQHLTEHNFITVATIKQEPFDEAENISSTDLVALGKPAVPTDAPNNRRRKKQDNNSLNKEVSSVPDSKKRKGRNVYLPQIKHEDVHEWDSESSVGSNQKSFERSSRVGQQIMHEPISTFGTELEELRTQSRCSVASLPGKQSGPQNLRRRTTSDSSDSRFTASEISLRETPSRHHSKRKGFAGYGSDFQCNTTTDTDGEIETDDWSCNSKESWSTTTTTRSRRGRPRKRSGMAEDQKMQKGQGEETSAEKQQQLSWRVQAVAQMRPCEVRLQRLSSSEMRAAMSLSSEGQSYAGTDATMSLDDEQNSYAGTVTAMSLGVEEGSNDKDSDDEVTVVPVPIKPGSAEIPIVVDEEDAGSSVSTHVSDSVSGEGTSVQDQDQDQDQDEDDAQNLHLTLTGHTGGILDLVNIGRLIVAACEDGSVYCYSLKTGRLKRVVPCGSKSMTCLAVTDQQGGQQVFAAGLDGHLHGFDFQTGEKSLEPLNVGGPIQCMDHNWGNIFLGLRDGTVAVYTRKTHQLAEERMKCSKECILSLKTTKEGPRQILLVGSRNQALSVRDAKTGLLMRTISQGTNPTVYCILMQQSLIYCGSNSGKISAYEFTNGREMFRFNAGAGVVVSIKIFRNLLFAGCYDGYIYVFNIKDKTLVSKIAGPGKMIFCLEIVKNRIIAASKDNNKLEARSFPAEVKKYLKVKPHAKKTN